MAVVPEVAARLDPRPPALAWLRTLFMAVLVGPLVMLVYLGWATREDAIGSAVGRLERIARIAQEQSQRIVETNEVISRAVITEAGSGGNPELRRRAGQLHQLLRSWAADLPQLQSVWIWDDAGHPIATNLTPRPSPALDVSDRAYFRWARSANPDGWYVSEPLRSRSTGEEFFDFVRRRSGPDGSFLGAVSVSLRPAYFEALFRQQLEGAPGITLSLVRADGVFVASLPGGTAEAGSPRPDLSGAVGALAAGSPAGQLQWGSDVGGERRVLAYRRIGEMPLYVVASAGRFALLAPWRRWMATTAAITTALALAIAALCWFAMRRVRSEHAIAQAHREQLEQRLKVEEALRQSQKMEALGRLTGGVAHDFNNILMVVQTSAALARQLESRGQPLGQALDAIERAVGNGSQLTRQLLAVARRQPLQRRTVDLGQVVPPVAQLMASTLGSRIHVSHALGEGLHVNVDQAELELALINLCINAKDAMPEGGELRIIAQAGPAPADAAPAGPWVCLTVSDAGEGIEPQLLARITEPFFTTKPLGKGTGLGLSQVHSFAIQSGGRLEIASQVGRGTQVGIHLPCSAPQPPAAMPQAAPMPRIHASVLLVEDNPDIGEAVSAILRHAGAEVVLRTTADEALRSAAEGLRVDVVLSDVTLPGENSGIDLARQLGTVRPRVPVVLMTGYTHRLAEASAAGFRVLAKPATADALLQALDEALGHRKQEEPA